jgi:hypothetical protein
MFLTKYTLNMLVENTEKALRTVQRLEIPEASSVPAFPDDVGLGGGGATPEFVFLFLKCIYEFTHGFLNLFEMLAVLNIINRSTSQQLGWCLELNWQSASPFQVNKGRNVPMFIDKNVTWMEVCE